MADAACLRWAYARALAHTLEAEKNTFLVQERGQSEGTGMRAVGKT